MRIILVLFLSVYLSGCASFNNQSADMGVNGWTVVGEKIWSTANGVTQSSAQPGKSYLVSNKQYSNFTLTLEFMPDSEVNSGVFVNCETNIKIGSKNCFEANISDNHKKPEFRTGSIVRHAVPSSKVNTIGKWNTMVFTVSGGKATVKINGVETAQASSQKHPKGYVALQRFKTGVIKFRNIKIVSL
ncbi:MAG: 3-keto-disaccharide hydrolase [Arenicella sp.]